MPLLEQQELIEKQPDRTVTMPQSLAAGWWGIDSSTTRFNVGTIDRDGARRVHSVRLGPQGAEGQRLTVSARQLRLLVHALLDDGAPIPAVVVVEQPSGSHVMPILWYTVGVALQTIYEEVSERCKIVPVIESVPPSRWKLVACGRGNLYKPKREKGAPPHPLDAYLVWSWARTVGMAEDGSWDDADAYGIAEYARKTIGIVG